MGVNSLSKSKIFFLTDFGFDSIYVAEMKAAVYQIDDDVDIIDITHSITPFDIQEAAFVIGMTYPFLPEDSKIVAVVDPGVGGDRKEIIVKTRKYLFVGPDNGIFSYVYKREGEKNFTVYQVKRDVFANISSTFHGRDIFAPAAALLASGKNLRKIAKKLEDFYVLDLKDPEVLTTSEGVSIKGRVMYVDKFGNLITNIEKELVDQTVESDQNVYVRVGKITITGVLRTFGDVPPGKPLAYIGSHDYLEIGINKGNARSSLGAGKGSIVEVIQLR